MFNLLPTVHHTLFFLFSNGVISCWTCPSPCHVTCDSISVIFFSIIHKCPITDFWKWKLVCETVRQYRRRRRGGSPGQERKYDIHTMRYQRPATPYLYSLFYIFFFLWRCCCWRVLDMVFLARHAHALDRGHNYKSSQGARKVTMYSSYSSCNFKPGCNVFLISIMQF